MKGGKQKDCPPEDPLKAAIHKHMQGHYEDAARTYREILSHTPDNVDALHFLGIAEQQRGDTEKALQYIGRAITLKPDHPDARYNRGNILKSLGRLDEAELDYRCALLSRPNDPNTLNNLGAIEQEQGDLESAASTFRKVVALAPAHAAAWQNLGRVLGTLNRTEEAIAAHREALRHDPRSPDAYYNVGRLLYAMGRLDEAADVYRRWLVFFPDDPRARHLLAACTGKAAPSRASDDYVRAEFDSFAGTFDSSLASLEYRGPALIDEEVTRIFGAPEPRLAVLDAGCGTGLCAPFLRLRASFLVGVDLSPAMIELARKRALFDALVVEEITAYLRHHEDSSDLIVLADTLVYFGDLTEISLAAAKALRPGGALVFTVERASTELAPQGFRVNPHGRYSHTGEYVMRVLADASLVDPVMREVGLRKEAGQWVECWLCSARAPGAPRAKTAGAQARERRTV